ncbi:DNA-directed RNA polymerase RPB3 [Giardia muris]|uniref:DNA-directed RNA polymerase RPB3 n=1 Tax=Giardia muris TaxID=5742 RepID=A0A4Z1T3X3_GIAMU|nr:DNA-directed RNA polymerase RPB3 [Giardia muris]|eukprot:TNJ27239.1 DNA-directed RNA polymerase RPB3 [Giardia muris]
MPHVRVLESTRDVLRLELAGAGLAYANGLRRAIYGDVPSLAIDTAFFASNNTSFTEEFLAHRLGLVPIRTEQGLDVVEYWYNCTRPHSAEYACPNCTYEGRLTAMNTGLDNLLVTDQEIQLPEGLSTLSQLGLQPPIPLLKLAPQEDIDVRLWIVKGKGKLHAKWCPASCVVVKPVPVVTLSSELPMVIEENLEAVHSYFADICPQNVFRMDGHRVLVAREEDCLFCNDCFNVPLQYRSKASQKAGDELRALQHVATVVPKPDTFHLIIESHGAIDPISIFRMACDELKRRALEILALHGTENLIEQRPDDVEQADEQDLL